MGFQNQQIFVFHYSINKYLFKSNQLFPSILLFNGEFEIISLFTI